MATRRSLVLRETVFWRTHDLLEQAHFLFGSKHVLGSRILIRSALESIAILIHLNQRTARVIAGEPNDFHLFDDETRKLLLGSRNNTTKHTSLNIVTVLGHCEKKYEGILNIYATLSECAHPNFEGVCFGYSDNDYEQNDIHFSNKWHSMWADRHDSMIKKICMIFEDEYNNVWTQQFDALESWLSEHDAELEATKNAQLELNHTP